MSTADATLMIEADAAAAAPIVDPPIARASAQVRTSAAARASAPFTTQAAALEIAPSAAPASALAAASATASGAGGMSPRTLRLLRGPIVPTLVSMAWPNVLLMLAQSSTGLIETWFVSRLGLAALAGMALVFPGFMLMQMLSAGAMGGGISSSIARALGGGRRDDANALVWHAALLNLALGVACAAAMLLFGRAYYEALGGDGEALEAALIYSNIVFAATPLVWLMSALGSVIRGTGNMLVPALTVCLSVCVLIPLSPLLIFGLGPVPAMGMAGAGLAVLLTTAGAVAILAWYLISGPSLVRFVRFRPRWPLFADILRVGGVASVNTLQTGATVALLTGLVGAAAGPDGVAGYGTGARLEFLLIPLVFGLGAPLVALVGTNIGAGQRDRALRVALIGGLLAFALCEPIGLTATIWPGAWLGLFGADRAMLATGASYLRYVGPFYGFFGLGLVLYFASQGAGRLAWPLIAGFLRMALAVGGGWIAWRVTHDLSAVFAVLGLALLTYGAVLAVAIGAGVWFRRPFV